MLRIFANITTSHPDCRDIFGASPGGLSGDRRSRGRGWGWAHCFIRLYAGRRWWSGKSRTPTIGCLYSYSKGCAGGAASWAKSNRVESAKWEGTTFCRLRKMVSVRPGCSVSHCWSIYFDLMAL